MEYTYTHFLLLIEKEDFALWAILPVEMNGMTFYGETNKWIGASAARVSKISTSSSSSKNKAKLAAINKTFKNKVVTDMKGKKVSEKEDGNKLEYTEESLDDFTVEMLGSYGEVLSVGFLNPSSSGYSLMTVQCNISESGRVFVTPTGCIASA